jgi:hypothetical protein
MPTGACGVNCDACRLRLVGICSSCGPGKSEQARKKLEAQQRILGGPCPILACAAMNEIDYCLRDCNAFPCDNFSSGPYPFSQGFLGMQQRRRQQRPPALDHNRRPVSIPEEYWEELCGRDFTKLCNWTLAQTHPEGGLQFRCLHRELWVDLGRRCIKYLVGERWETLDDPLLAMITLLYFNGVTALLPLGKDLIGPKDLKEAHYFTGDHALPLTPVLERYGNDLQGFRRVATYLDGQVLDMADAAFRLHPFPRVPLTYLIWEGDDEFSPKLSVLFDRSIEDVFSASAIWILIKVVNNALLQGPVETHGKFCQEAGHGIQ